MLQRIFQMLQQLYIRILIDVLFYLWYEFCVNSVIYVKEIVIFACDFDMDSEYRNFVSSPLFLITQNSWHIFRATFLFFCQANILYCLRTRMLESDYLDSSPNNMI